MCVQDELFISLKNMKDLSTAMSFTRSSVLSSKNSCFVSAVLGPQAKTSHL